MKVTIDMNPRTQGMVHPEQQPMEYFLGYFEPKFAEEKLEWKTKRIGSIALTEDGKPYSPNILEVYRPVPVFVLHSEFLVHFYQTVFGAGRINTTA